MRFLFLHVPLLTDDDAEGAAEDELAAMRVWVAFEADCVATEMGMVEIGVVETGATETGVAEVSATEEE